MKRIIAAFALCALASASLGQTTPRQIQVRSINFQKGTVELFNFGPTNVSLNGWRFCTHDFNEAFLYTLPAGLNGVTIESGTSVFVHVNNDAPAGNPDRINRSTLGGGFATPLDQDAYGMQLYFPDANGFVSFGNSAQIADHIQWNIAGQFLGSSQSRTTQAVSEGLWSATGVFIATQTNSAGIVLTDLSGDAAGSPAEYAVIASPSLHNELLDGDLSDDPASPTALGFPLGTSVVTGQVNASNDTVLGDRDFITFTIPAGRELTGLTLGAWTPDNLGFLAVSSGSTGFIPSPSTDANFLAGILIASGNVGSNLLIDLDTAAVTINNLAQPRLDPGTYTLVVQQTSNLVQDYRLEFVVTDQQACVADFNGVGGVTVQDIFDFLAAYFANSPSADVNGAGGITVQDIFDYLAAYFQGCD